MYFIMSLVVHNFCRNASQLKMWVSVENRVQIRSLTMKTRFHKHPFCQVGYGSSVSLSHECIMMEAEMIAVQLCIKVAKGFI